MPTVGGFDAAADIDADIREVFLEEFEEERANLERMVPHWQEAPEKAEILSDYLSTASLAEHLDYPICAKDYQQSIGNFTTALSRAREAGNYYSAHFQSNMQQMVRLGEIIKKQLSI